jgi:hypothetical protein
MNEDSKFNELKKGWWSSIKKNGLGWVITLGIAIGAQYFIFSKNVNYQTTQKTQEELIRLDREKIARNDLTEVKKELIEADRLLDNKLEQTRTEFIRALKENNKEQTDRLIEIYKTYKK